MPQLLHPGWTPSRLREQRTVYGLSQADLAEKIRNLELDNAPLATPEMVGRHERGTSYPGTDYRAAYCHFFRRSEPALGFRHPLPAEKESHDAAVCGEVTGIQHDERGAPEVDRRNLVGLGGLVVAAACAADLSRSIARADPDPLTLDDMEAEVQDIALTYRTTPHLDLVARLDASWRAAERLLDSRVSPRVRSRLALVAGQQAFYLGTLAFDLGDDRAARGFLALAGQHATQTRDPLLIGSVAAMRSSLAYFNGAHANAADIAGEALERAHPFTRPILAGCRARAAALAGRPAEARTALGHMQDHVWHGPVMPGPNPGNDEFAHGFLAVALAHLGSGEQAEWDARHSIELLRDSGHYVQLGGSYTALCRAFLRRAAPDPEQAADSAGRALEAMDVSPSRSVIQSTTQMWHEMAARWPDLPAVRDLGDAVVTAHTSLAPKTTTPAASIGT